MNTKKIKKEKRFQAAKQGAYKVTSKLLTKPQGPAMQAGLPVKIPDSMQDTVPYDALFRSGISRTGRNYYTKTLSFTDINYQLAQEDEQARVFEWCTDFLLEF